MTAVFRFVSLIGVLSAGFYVLYLTQARMSESRSLTEKVSQGPAPLTLGAEGQHPGMPEMDDPWKAAGSDSPATGSDVPLATAAPGVFSATSNPASTVVASAAPGSDGGLDFRGPADADSGTSDPGIVTAAMESSDPKEITLTANEHPFAEETSLQPAESGKPPALESIDPFEAQNPFDTQPSGSDKPASKPESEPVEFDPFGENVKAPEPSAPEKPSDRKPAETPADEFPRLDLEPPQPRPSGSGTKPASATKKPVPADDPFAPFPDEPPAKTDDGNAIKTAEGAAPARKPAVSDDPFRELAAGNKPTDNKPPERIESPAPAGNPFDEPFPELKAVDEKPTERKPLKPVDSPAPADNPFGTSETNPATNPATPEAFPDFPAERPAADKPADKSGDPQPAKPLESGFDPFADETPAPRLADKPDTPQPQPREFPGEETPSRTDALPSLDELEDELKKSAGQDLPTREPVPSVKPLPETPKPLPSFEDVSDGSPGAATGSPRPDELKSVPTGIVPSMSDLKGDGVLTPDTPRKVQLPYLEIHKNAPSKALLNQPFVYTILVKNVGEAAANEVTVQDQIPKGTNLTGTIPQAELVGRRLVWKLGRIEPGVEQKVAVRVIPVESGPIGSVATVNFVAEVGAETVVEHPEVTFQMALPQEANVGDVVECRFEIVNRGSQTVSGIVLRDIIPEGLHHPAGNDLENPLGDLKPGEKLSESLELKVLQAGAHVNQAVLTAEGGLELKQEARLEAAGNRLVILRRGPKERFVGRPAMYQNVVQNSSQETVRDAIVVEKLPAGMQFVQAGQGGQYHAAGGEVYWKIPEIGPGQAVTLDVQMTATTPGVGESLVRVRESQGKEIQAVSHTNIRSYASIGLNVTEFDQPILVGDTVVMRVEATNRGNAAANTVQLRATIPPTLALMSVRGKTRFRVEGQSVVFETLQALPPGATEIIELELQAAAPAKAEVAVSVQSQGMSKPLVKAAAVPVHSRQ